MSEMREGVTKINEEDCATISFVAGNPLPTVKIKKHDNNVIDKTYRYDPNDVGIDLYCNSIDLVNVSYGSCLYKLGTGVCR